MRLFEVTVVFSKAVLTLTSSTADQANKDNSVSIAAVGDAY